MKMDTNSALYRNGFLW